MRKFTAAALLLTIAISISVMWVTEKWATAIPEVATLGLGAVWAVAGIAGRRKIRWDVVMIPIGGVAVWGGLQLLTGSTVYPWVTYMALIYWAGNLATVFAGLQALSAGEVRERFLQGLVVLGFLVSVLASLQALTPNGKIYWIFPTEYSGWNLLGPFVYHNQYAAFIELLLPIALWQALSGGKWRLFYLLMAATMYASVLVSASRAGFALSTAELFLVPLVALRRRLVGTRAMLVAAGVLLGMVALLGISAGPQALMSRLTMKDPYAVRRELVYASAAMLREKPVLGFGLGSWATAYPGYAVFDDGTFTNQAHNDWAQWAVEGGLPLVCLMLWTAVTAVRRGVKTGWGLGVGVVFIHCWVDYPIQRTAVAVVFFVLLAAMHAAGGDGSQTRRLRSIKNAS